MTAITLEKYPWVYLGIFKKSFIMSASEQMRAMLDQLMGTARNGKNFILKSELGLFSAIYKWTTNKYICYTQASCSLR